MQHRVSSPQNIMTQRWPENGTCGEAHVLSTKKVKKKPGQESLQSKYSTTVTNTAPFPSLSNDHYLRGRISPFIYGSNSHVRCSHLCPQDPTGFVHFLMPDPAELLCYARSEGKAQTPPIARVKRRMEQDSYKDRLEQIFAKNPEA